MNARTPRRALVALFLIFWAAAAIIAQDQKIPGQAQLPILQDGFKFVPGAWASYAVFDKAKNETYALKFSALERETIKGRSYSWLEIEIEMKGTPPVVTSILAEETGQGPGRIEKAIVQVKGMSPFTVPRKYLEGQDKTVAEFRPARIVRRLENRKAVCGGKTIDVLAVEAEDDKGQKVNAQVSLQLPPITVYEAETADLKMTATDFGGGARTRIDGLPLPFALWLIEVTADALTKKK